jgi:hypothetical protein
LRRLARRSPKEVMMGVLRLGMGIALKQGFREDAKGKDEVDAVIGLAMYTKNVYYAVIKFI